MTQNKDKNKNMTLSIRITYADYDKLVKIAGELYEGNVSLLIRKTIEKTIGKGTNGRVEKKVSGV